MLEKLQRDRVELLLHGAQWKKKRDRDIQKDNQCCGVVEKLKNGKLRSKRYLEIVIKIMGDY